MLYGIWTFDICVILCVCRMNYAGDKNWYEENVACHAFFLTFYFSDNRLHISGIFIEYFSTAYFLIKNKQSKSALEH